jgi:hypothetical protein
VADFVDARIECHCTFDSVHRQLAEHSRVIGLTRDLNSGASGSESRKVLDVEEVLSLWADQAGVRLKQVREGIPPFLMMASSRTKPAHRRQFLELLGSARH